MHFIVIIFTLGPNGIISLLVHTLVIGLVFANNLPRVTSSFDIDNFNQIFNVEGTDEVATTLMQNIYSSCKMVVALLFYKILLVRIENSNYFRMLSS